VGFYSRLTNGVLSLQWAKSSSDRDGFAEHFRHALKQRSFVFQLKICWAWPFHKDQDYDLLWNSSTFSTYTPTSSAFNGMDPKPTTSSANPWQKADPIGDVTRRMTSQNIGQSTGPPLTLATEKPQTEPNAPTQRPKRLPELIGSDKKRRKLQSSFKVVEKCIRGRETSAGMERKIKVWVDSLPSTGDEAKDESISMSQELLTHF
jgi:hypothetical protein